MSNGPMHDESFRREIDARVGHTLCQRYTLEAVLAIGATGAVYRASHRSGNRVAIKALHAELCATTEVREQFLREAKVGSRVEHPGVVRILDDDIAEDGTVFLVMDLLEGETLEARILRQGGGLSASEVVPIACQVLDVLAAAHAKGVVHGGVDPSNVFITRDRAVKLLGFGTAGLASGSRIAARIGRGAEAAAYLAPEQARGEAMQIDAQTDVWATGAMMFRALSGQFVYAAVTPELIRARAATEPAPPIRSLLPSLEPDVAEIVDRALGWTKAGRWAAAQAMATALRATRGAVGQSAPPPAFVAAAPPRSTPPPAFVAAAPSGPPAAPVHAGVPAAPPPGYASAPVAPLPYAPGPRYEPAPADNGWIKWVAGVAVLLMIFLTTAGAATFLILRKSSSHSKAQPLGHVTAWSDEASPVPVTSLDPVWGSREAPVTIVIFSDFQCPFCSRVGTTLSQVKTAYGPDKVRIVWKNQPLPFHQNAKPAAEAAQVVFTLEGSDAFFKFHDLAFANQQRLTAENFRTWARAAGADSAAFDRAVATHAAAAKVEEDSLLGKKIGALGTPAFRINGITLSGAQPLDKFKQVIDAELAKAAAELATGTPKDKLYVVLSTRNFTQPAANKDDTAPPADSTTVWRVPVVGSPSRGNVDAPVTIVEFGDFQCPFCKRAEPTIERIRDTYGERVRIVWKNNPLAFHRRAEPAAELALEARAEKGDAGFWRAYDKLFDAQTALEDEDLVKIGAQLGLDGARVKTALRSNVHARQIGADADLADDLKATGTPQFFINGRRLVGAQPFEAFQKIIDDEIKKFEDQNGRVSARDYYASVMRDAQGPPELEKKWAPAVPASAPYRGGKNAPVVIQEWADFQCPFCARVEPTLAEVLKLYGNRVKLVWRDKPLPMHPDAALAAELAREALAERGPDGFWRMHDKLFANQQRLKRDDLEVYAGELHLDMNKVASALDGKAHQQEIDADDKLSAGLGLTGTPAFIINGYVLNGAQPLSKFRKLIERALAEAPRAP